MKWPRGRYNGRRVVGLDVHMKIDVTSWRLRWFDRYGGALRVGPLFVWAGLNYAWRD